MALFLLSKKDRVGDGAVILLGDGRGLVEGALLSAQKKLAKGAAGRVGFGNCGLGG
jgi:hypothetical protein